MLNQAGRQRALALAAASLVVLIGAIPVRADEPIGLYVDRSWIVLEAEPETTIASEIGVTYRGAGHGTIDVLVQEFEPLPNGGLRMMEPRSDRPSPSTWVQAPASLAVVAEQTAPLAVRITPAVGTPPGEYSALLVLQARPADERGISLRPQVGVRVVARVPGAMAPAGILAGLTANRTIDLGQQLLGVRLTNSGNVHLESGGVVRATPLRLGPLVLGAETEQVGASPSGHLLIAPGTTRDFAVAWNPPGYGLYQVSYVPVEGAFAGQPTAWVVVAPWSALLTALLLLLVGGYLVGAPQTAGFRHRLAAAWRAFRHPATP